MKKSRLREIERLIDSQPDGEVRTAMLDLFNEVEELQDAIKEAIDAVEPTFDRDEDARAEFYSTRGV